MSWNGRQVNGDWHDNGDQYREGGAVQEISSWPHRQGGNHAISRPTNLDRRPATRRSADRWSWSRSRSRTGGAARYGPESQEIEDVLQYIEQEWDFMAGDKCVPVQVGLRLMDESSLGLATRYEDFKDAQNRLENALKSIVNEHHQGFSSSIATFHQIQASIQTSQNRVRNLKKDLVQAKSSLATTKPELKALAISSQEYDEMLQILGTIEQLRLTPEKIEAQISAKRFISAVEVLQYASRLSKRSEMDSIGALTELKLYLSNQEHSLTDILIEELHSHLCLKSPYCEDRWKSYASLAAREILTPTISASVEPMHGDLHIFLNNMDNSSSLTDETTRNPESNSFLFIQILLEALNKMDRLEVAVHRIEQRLPLELFRIVERTNSEVDQRHPESVWGRHLDKNHVSEGFGDVSEGHKSLLYDLLSTMFAKFEAIAEGHRVVHEVLSSIIKREGFGDATGLTKGFKELWNLYQSEIRSILHDYLATNGGGAFRGGHGAKSNSNIYQRNQRDKAKLLFKLSDMDQKSTELTTERESLEFILKASVPGLVSDPQKQPDPSNTETYKPHDTSGTGHSVLAEPSVFNMSTLLTPCLSFLNRLRDIVPPSADISNSSLTSFLDDFLMNVFHPQLEETLADCAAQIFIAIDSFQIDQQSSSVLPRPIFKGTRNFYNLIVAFSNLLDALPHDQAFSQLIVSQAVTYYEKCFGWYKALVSRAQPKPESGRRWKASAAAAETGDVHDVVVAMWESDRPGSAALIEEEVALLLKQSSADALDDGDLVSDNRTIGALCVLYNSLNWFAGRTKQLSRITSKATDSSKRDSGRLQLQRLWTEVSMLTRLVGFVYLPLTQENARVFEGVLDSYRDLASLVLRTLHLELRYQIIHKINVSLQGSYLLENPKNEPEPGVLLHNGDLVAFDEEISTLLPQREHAFIVNGLSAVVDALILQQAPRFAPMNINGCNLMKLNVLVLQQNLKNIEPNAALSRSTRYFDLFAEGPAAIVAKAKEAKGDETKLKALGFSYDEMKALLELCFSEAVSGDRREVSMGAKRQMDDLLLQLNEHMWQA